MDLSFVASLFLLWVMVTSAEVLLPLPPTNVNLQCGNLKNTLTWTYPQFSPGLRFKININSISKTHDPLWVDPPNLQVDVSSLSDPSNEYFVNVSAVIGPNEAASEGITFSYYRDAVSVDKICSLDLPPVTVTAQLDDKLLVRFQHPELLYPEHVPVTASPKDKKNKKMLEELPEEELPEEELPEFQYKVINQARDNHPGFCVESVCELTIPVSRTEEKHCVNITGELRGINVVGRREYCVEAFKVRDYLMYVYGVISILVSMAIAGICFMVFKKMTNTDTTQLPNFMTRETIKQWTSNVMVREPVLTPELEPTSPCPLLSEDMTSQSSPDGTDPTDTTESGYRFRIRVPTENEGPRRDEYMQGSDMAEEGDEEHSSYERRPGLVELGPGEHAEAYRS